MACVSALFFCIAKGAALRIKKLQIKNYRGFENETIHLEPYTCLVGPNGAGKSTVLSALNVFFQDASSSTEVSYLTKEDFHKGDTSKPIEITVTFGNLSAKAKEELSHYVRHEEVSVTAIAEFSEPSGKAPVFQYGERLVFKTFAPFFEDDKNKVLVEPLRERFFEVTKGLDGFPDIGKKPTKAAMVEALRGYEESKPEICTAQRSGDQFYGLSKGKGKLEPFVQWVYLPAVKDASEETQEAANTALGKLLQRTVRQKVSFEEDLEALRKKTREAFDALLGAQQTALKELSDSLAKRLSLFANPSASLVVEWLQGAERSVVIADPKATVRAQEGAFSGDLVRFGHGFQRSFLLAILQELASLEQVGGEGDAPTLIFGCEEPELYQHPPQARHLAAVLKDLSEHGNQIVSTTHSAYFVSGESFEEVRLIRKDSSSKSFVKATDYERFSNRMSLYSGKKPDKPGVARAKLLTILHPEAAELFFCQALLLVEGGEDRAYVAGAIHLDGKDVVFRRAGFHIVPADKKSKILELLAIAKELEIPCFVIFDADGDEDNPTRRSQHERDNLALLKALELTSPAFPASMLLGKGFAIWPTQLDKAISECVPTWVDICNEARAKIDPGSSLKKNPAFIAEALSLAREKGAWPKVLSDLVAELETFVGGV